MTRANDIASLVDSNGDIVAGALDNVPPSNDASALTTGTLDAARLPTEIVSSDTTPQLGGTLDVNDQLINNSGSDGVRIQHSGTTRFQTYAQGVNVGGGNAVAQSGLTVSNLSLSVQGADGDWAQGGARAFMDFANGEARAGAATGGASSNASFRMYANGHQSMGIHNRGYTEIASNTSGDGLASWQVVREGTQTRATKRFSTGSSAANVNLFYYRRHYWGGGNYKIILKQTYYNDSYETHYWINGNSRPGQSVTVNRTSQNGDLGSARIYQVSRSSSYPGDNTVAEAVIWGLNIPSYVQYTVILDFDNANGSWKFDDSGLNSTGNSWRLL